MAPTAMRLAAFVLLVMPPCKVQGRLDRAQLPTASLSHSARRRLLQLHSPNTVVAATLTGGRGCAGGGSKAAAAAAAARVVAADNEGEEEAFWLLDALLHEVHDIQNYITLHYIKILHYITLHYTLHNVLAARRAAPRGAAGDRVWCPVALDGTARRTRAVHTRRRASIARARASPTT